MKRVILLFILIITAYLLFITGSGVPYGNNKQAGKYCNIRGFKMYYEVYGSGKPLLMIHGNNGSIATFKNNIPYFAQKYKVIAADSRAQGRSTDQRDSLTFEMMADDEAALLDSLHIRSAYVLGWSDGGVIALLMAIRHPDKVIKLASSGANLRPDTSAIDATLWKDQQKIYYAGKNKILKTNEEKNSWKLFLLDWLQPNIQLSQIHLITCPVFIIGGDHDLIPQKHIRQIYQNVPNARLWIIPHSGHATLAEHKNEFNKRVNEFFEPLSAH